MFGILWSHLTPQKFTLWMIALMAEKPEKSKVNSNKISKNGSPPEYWRSSNRHPWNSLAEVTKPRTGLLRCFFSRSKADKEAGKANGNHLFRLFKCIYWPFFPLRSPPQAKGRSVQTQQPKTLVSSDRNSLLFLRSSARRLHISASERWHRGRSLALAAPLAARPCFFDVIIHHISPDSVSFIARTCGRGFQSTWVLPAGAGAPTVPQASSFELQYNIIHCKCFFLPWSREKATNPILFFGPNPAATFLPALLDWSLLLDSTAISDSSQNLLTFCLGLIIFT